MFDSITVSAPSKINLGLKVFPRRSDGFHNIQSIFTTVNLNDELRVSLISENDVCDVNCEGMVLPENNTITQTYKAFCVLTGIHKGVRVDIKKRIPSGGGLGGGSSDSSSFLKSIDTLFGTNLSESDFMQISGLVGSDVFFFTKALLAGNSENNHFTAIVEGRGEIIKEIPSRNDFFIVLLFPGVQVSTKEAYSLVDEYMQQNEELVKKSHECFFESEWQKEVECWRFVNDFTLPVVQKYSTIGIALADLRNSGADFADMSGSGATLYGIFCDRNKAIQAVNFLSKKWKTVLV